MSRCRRWPFRTRSRSIRSRRRKVAGQTSPPVRRDGIRIRAFWSGDGRWGHNSALEMNQRHCDGWPILHPSSSSASCRGSIRSVFPDRGAAADTGIMNPRHEAEDDEVGWRGGASSPPCGAGRWLEAQRRDGGALGRITGACGTSTTPPPRYALSLPIAWGGDAAIRKAPRGS